MKTIFETKRLLVREMSDDDFDAIQQSVHYPDGSIREDAEVRRWIHWCQESYQKNGFGHGAVVLKATGEVIGSAGISLQPIDGKWLPEAGYHLRGDYHRQGLGKEVACAARDYYFTHFDGDAVYSYMDEDNVASYKTAEASGMTYQHLFTARTGAVCRIYRITRTEWLALTEGNPHP